MAKRSRSRASAIVVTPPAPRRAGKSRGFPGRRSAARTTPFSSIEIRSRLVLRNFRPRRFASWSSMSGKGEASEGESGEGEGGEAKRNT